MKINATLKKPPKQVPSLDVSLQEKKEMGERAPSWK
jgi:hypothetical protein